MSGADACSVKVKAEGSKKDLAQGMQVILYLQKVKNINAHQPVPELNFLKPVVTSQSCSGDTRLLSVSVESSKVNMLTSAD